MTAKRQPARHGQKHQEPQAEKGAPQPSGEKTPLILIVDDYEDARVMWAQLLKFHGYRTEQASNGLEAVEKAVALSPAVILMDLSLPGMDGWEASRRLKADPRTRGIQIIAVTGHALAGHSEKAREAGCDLFVTKPVFPNDLLEAVRRSLETMGKRAAGQAS